MLLPSPLLGPAVWRPVAELLTERGHSVVVVGYPEQIRSPTDVVDALLAQVPDDELVLVPHSNAGLYVGALAGSRPVRAVVYVDAALPGDEETTPTAPDSLREHLAGLADDEGLLPPWTRWWPEDEVAGLFPDPGTRETVEREQRRLPLSYFEAQVPTPPAWRTVRSTYLSFGQTYAGERARAERAGWPLATLPGDHLHMLHDPHAVADAVERAVLDD